MKISRDVIGARNLSSESNSKSFESGLNPDSDLHITASDQEPSFIFQYQQANVHLNCCFLFARSLENCVENVLEVLVTLLSDEYPSVSTTSKVSVLNFNFYFCIRLPLSHTLQNYIYFSQCILPVVCAVSVRTFDIRGLFQLSFTEWSGGTSFQCSLVTLKKVCSNSPVMLNMPAETTLLGHRSIHRILK